MLKDSFQISCNRDYELKIKYLMDKERFNDVNILYVYLLNLYYNKIRENTYKYLRYKREETISRKNEKIIKIELEEEYRKKALILINKYEVVKYQTQLGKFLLDCYYGENPDEEKKALSQTSVATIVTYEDVFPENENMKEEKEEFDDDYIEDDLEKKEDFNIINLNISDESDENDKLEADVDNKKNNIEMLLLKKKIGEMSYKYIKADDDVKVKLLNGDVEIEKIVYMLINEIKKSKLKNNTEQKNDEKISYSNIDTKNIVVLAKSKKTAKSLNLEETELLPIHIKDNQLIALSEIAVKNDLEVSGDTYEMKANSLSLYDRSIEFLIEYFKNSNI